MRFHKLFFLFILAVLALSVKAQFLVDKAIVDKAIVDKAIKVNNCNDKQLDENPAAAPEVGKATELQNDNQIKTLLTAKQELIVEYQNSNQLGKKESQSASEKKILNVGWFDASFNRISTTRQDEPISLAVLTKGYQLGNPVKITIGVNDDQSLMDDADCLLATFVGVVNHENLAYLQDVFMISGENSRMTILPEWKDKYYCKD